MPQLTLFDTWLVSACLGLECWTIAIEVDHVTGSTTHADSLTTRLAALGPVGPRSKAGLICGKHFESVYTCDDISFLNLLFDFFSTIASGEINVGATLKLPVQI